MKNQNDFQNKSEFFDYLIQNKKELIAFKKSAIKHSEVFETDYTKVSKTLFSNHSDDLSTGIIKRTIIGNTYNWMDNHGDVHLNNVFEKSIKDKGVDKIWHLHDHEQKITAKVGKPVSITEKEIAWKDLGVNVDGNTMALFMESNISKELNSVVFGQYLSKEINQHSVAMQYVRIDLAVNDPEQKDEFKVWTKHILEIGNKEKVMEQGYFFAVAEAKLVEISAVLQGSNELTPTIENKLLTTENVEKWIDEAVEKEISSIYEKINKKHLDFTEQNKQKGIDYNYLVENL